MVRLLCFFSSVSLFCFLTLPVFAGKPEAILRIEQVGQGNGITLKVKKAKKGSPAYMVIDMGASTFTGELAYTDQQSPVKETSIKLPQGLKSPSPKTLSKEEIKDIEWSKGGEAILESNKVIEKVRKALGAQKTKKKGEEKSEKKPPIHVKTVVITHPDEDHYKWLKSLFGPEDKLDYLILGGLPENYNKETREWIEELLPKEGQEEKGKPLVFFPAIKFDPITSLDEVMPIEEEEEDILKTLKSEKEESLESREIEESLEILEEKEPPKKEIQAESKKEKEEEEEEKEKHERSYAEHAYFDPKKGLITASGKALPKDFLDAFDFGEDVKVYPLSINPTHHQGKHSVLRSAIPTDDNSDSLVIKIACGQSSTILTGDATSVTTDRIIDDYSQHLDFLKTNILVASHHGANTEGSNSKKWLKMTNPECFFTSNGFSQGHPNENVYQRVKKDPDKEEDKVKRLKLGTSKNLILERNMNKKRKMSQRGGETRSSFSIF